ncbi:CPBP family intramembrane glutamic endopeptidase [Microtetraspora niveoalba]|uniref:CPBP family intramembrane glutamic endopeptidase n=1 Tax=Microtetraspora niveoalba TaxID=46175 RepID=UPI0008368634|nr:CPBP family intramembrane glutamic endopeptidase [Microtetraspora niveoalba]
MTISPEFSTLAAWLAAPLVAYLLLLTPWLGRRSYERLVRHRDGDPRALLRMFRSWIAESWGLMAVALVLAAMSPGVGLADLGLVAPPGGGSHVTGMVVGATIGLAVVTVVLRRRAKSGRDIPGQAAFSAMLPRTTAERWAAAAMAVTAGVCEEVLYRGFLIALGVGVFGLDVKVAAGAALVVFVAGHWYQGWKGMIMVALLGCALTGMYLSQGSLLIPIIAHVLIDLRGLLLVPAPTRAGRADTGAIEPVRG